MPSPSMIRARLACLLVTATRPTAARRIQCVQPIAHGIQRRGLGRLPQGEQANNPLEDPQQDMGGPGGQELYPVSMALHKRYASITAAGIMTACVVMYMAKRLEWGLAQRDPGIGQVLIHDNTKGELDDVRLVPVRVRVEGVRRPH